MFFILYREYATKEKVKEAHRRIMLLNHPDRGGSPFVASKINQAKELLEKTIRK
jgi:DnaJ family protein C protein 19